MRAPQSGLTWPLRIHLGHLRVAAFIQPELLLETVFQSLRPDIGANRPLIPTQGGHQVAAGPRCCPTTLRDRPANSRAMWTALFPLMSPITCANVYFGRIDDSTRAVV